MVVKPAIAFRTISASALQTNRMDHQAMIRPELTLSFRASQANKRHVSLAAGSLQRPDLLLAIMCL